MPPERAAVAKEAMATEPLVPGTEPLIREQDRLMPVANVSRIMRHALPPYAKISDDAKEMIQDCVSEFISFVTGEANERCHTEHRKTVTAEDLVWAMNRLGFDDYIRPLNAYPQRMREVEAGGAGGRGSGRGSRCGTSLAALHGAQTMRPAYPDAPQGYSVRPFPRPVPVPGSSAASHFGSRYQQMPGGQRSMVPYYGGAAFRDGGSHEGILRRRGKLVERGTTGAACWIAPLLAEVFPVCNKRRRPSPQAASRSLMLAAGTSWWQARVTNVVVVLAGVDFTFLFILQIVIIMLMYDVSHLLIITMFFAINCY
ncbi:nuclear transcription factor Y subunit B-10-like [Panicum miliaceum]|uniref:Nuclear transcription factor Y subunit B-10-like n=1 Tax=Panicum miliaceum TaxID=4540 RepID=A0A3L6S0G7_PANMI|nr:nuclear transcription factor Y subunit B-10-like [Panicum miliaceum]